MRNYKKVRGHLALVLCASAAAAFSPEVANAQDIFGKHTYDETKRTADRLASVEPGTVWELPTRGEAADLIEFISNDRLLVGVIDVNKNAAPSYGRVYLVDANDGSELWEYNRNKGPSGSFSLLATSPVLLLMYADQGSMELTALDPASGKKVWDLDADAPYGVAIAPDRQLLLVVFGDGNKNKIRGVDLASGDRNWELTLEAGTIAPSTPVSIQVDGKSAFVFGRSIVEVDLSAGGIVRTMEATALAEDAGTAMLLSDGFLVWDAQAVTYVDRESGAPRWTGVRPDPSPARS